MGRKLRVDFSHEGNAPDDVDTASYSQQPQQNQTTLPSGTDMPEGISAPDAISTTLKALPVPQLLEILQQMKTLVNQDPVKATDLLRQAPQLSYAIFQALLLMNLVDTTVLTQVIETSGGTAPPPQPVQQQPPVQQQQPPQQYYQPPAGTPTPPVPAPAVDPQRAQLMQSVLHLTPEQIASFPPEQQQQILFLKQQYMAGGTV
jgi:cleavage stimulation factor subunit 2